MTSITPYVIISQWDYKYPMIDIPGLRDIPLLGPQGFIVACKYDCS